MEYIIIGILILLVVLVTISLFKNINEGNITERLGKLENNVTRDLYDFKNDINNSFYSVHGLTYFLKDKDNQYREMLADYVALLKSPNGKYYIDKLREKGFGSIIDKIDKVYRYSGYEESVSLQ